jgi:hypothetical protein
MAGRNPSWLSRLYSLDGKKGIPCSHCGTAEKSETELGKEIDNYTTNNVS